MAFHRFVPTLLCAIMLFGQAVVANAAAMISTYTAVLDSGEDLYGFFGTGSSNLGGQSVTMQFFYDVGRAGSFQGDTATGFSAAGGTLNGFPGPITNAILTINGRSFHTPLAHNNFVYRVNDALQDNGRDQIVGGMGVFQSRFFLANVFTDTGSPYGRPISVSGPGNIVFIIEESRFGERIFYTRGEVRGLVNVTVAPANTVPEAPVWAMLISGFGIVGCSLRRRHRIAA